MLEQWSGPGVRLSSPRRARVLRGGPSLSVPRTPAFCEPLAPRWLAWLWAVTCGGRVRLPRRVPGPRRRGLRSMSPALHDLTPSGNATTRSPRFGGLLPPNPWGDSVTTRRHLVRFPRGRAAPLNLRRSPEVYHVFLLRSFPPPTSPFLPRQTNHQIRRAHPLPAMPPKHILNVKVTTLCSLT